MRPPHDDRPRPHVLFIGGSINQTTQMERIADAMPEVRATFAPYYQDGWGTVALKLGFLEMTIGGHKMQRRCVEHLRANGRDVDLTGDAHDYDAVVLSTDMRFMKNIRRKKVVLVQEGIITEPNVFFPIVHRFPWLPRWWAGVAATGLSKMYSRFCVASEGYKEYFTSIGCDPAKIDVTGIPNFDDCDAYRKNAFPHRGYVMVATSDARETFQGEDRRAFVEKAKAIAAGRPMIFKLHPNENAARAKREIMKWAPGSLIFAQGNAEEMVANCDVLVCQYSSLAFVGLALGKEVHSHYPLERLRSLLPLQNRSAARNIAGVVREVLRDAVPQPSPSHGAAHGIGVMT